MIQAYMRAIFRLILLGWVALNLVMASVPRCDMVLAAVHKSVTASNEHDHCAPQKTGKGPILHDHRICACVLAKLVFGRTSEIRRDPIVTRQPQALSVIEFTYQFAVIQHTASIETPPPRAV